MGLKQRKVGKEELLKIVVLLFSLRQADNDADGNLLPPDYSRVRAAALIRKVKHLLRVADAHTSTNASDISATVSSDLLHLEHMLTSEAWDHAGGWWPGYGAIAVGNCWHSRC